jgi:type II secretory pathway pseudopilin PulG
MTLLEILIVLGVMGLMMFLGVFTLRSVSKSALRSATVEVAAALKSAHNLATQSGMHHRLVIDLDKQTYQIEVCPDPIQLARGRDEEEQVDQDALKRLSEQPNPLDQPTGLAGAGGALPQLPGIAGVGAALGEVSDATSPEAALNAAAAIAGVRVGAARCGIASASGGDMANFKDAPNVHALETSGGDIKVRRVYVQHLHEPITTGQVSINFFPLGHAEKALLEVADDEGTQFTILLHGLTGRVEVRDGEVDPDHHMRRNAAGDEVDEP